MARPLSLMVALVLGLTACGGGGGSDARVLTAKDARVLTAREVFGVRAVQDVQTDGYTVESAVCEVVSSEKYRPGDGVFPGGDVFGKLVFHAFRVDGPGVNRGTVVLFGSNSTAADGKGLVVPVNDAAVDIFSPGSNLNPITDDMNGASAAVACAQQADDPPAVGAEGFNVEAWRAEVIERFGPEQSLDGFQNDYVLWAFAICDVIASDRDLILGASYDGSFRQFAAEEFCPNVFPRVK